MTLKDLYDRGTDIREFEIPEKWRKSFNEFMFGSTCLADVDEDGNVVSYVYYYHDFRGWYHQNQAQIERDEKINSIIKK